MANGAKCCGGEDADRRVGPSPFLGLESKFLKGTEEVRESLGS